MAAGKVLILEDDADLAFTYEQLIALLTDRQVVTVHGVSALKERREDALLCDVAILDIDLGDNKPSGIDAYRWLREQGFGGKIFFLTGHARSHPLVAQAVAMGGATVLAKPIETERFIELITGKGV